MSDELRFFHSGAGREAGYRCTIPSVMAASLFGVEDGVHGVLKRCLRNGGKE
jgi:hypothetical protein